MRQQGRRAAVEAAGGVYEEMCAAARGEAQRLMVPDLPRTVENAECVQATLLAGLSGLLFPPQRQGGLVSLVTPEAPAGYCMVPGCDRSCAGGNRVTVDARTGKLGLSYTHLKNTVSSGTSRDIGADALSPSLSVRPSPAAAAA